MAATGWSVFGERSSNLAVGRTVEMEAVGAAFIYGRIGV